MSSLGGFFCCEDAVNLSAHWSQRFEEALSTTAPDGGNNYQGPRIGMWYRAFRTTDEECREEQPYVASDFVVTWDGRLDNRDELWRAVGLGSRWDQTDLTLVREAYGKWGADCFSHFVGDWAIAIWDRRKREVLLARDFIGVRRLFYHKVARGLAWCSVLEPLVKAAGTKFTPDEEYLLGCIVPRPPIESSPYREIRAVIPGFLVRCDRHGNLREERYWKLRADEVIRYKQDAEYEEHFRHVLQVAVERRMRANRPILADLSGGLDSSSIVCMADLVSKARNLPFVETFSYFNTDDPSGDERRYFEQVECARGRVGHHLAQADFDVEIEDDALCSLPKDMFVATPGYLCRSLRWAEKLYAIWNSLGSRVSLSGVGGDELLGGVPYGPPELAEYLLAARLGRLAKGLLAWARQAKRPIYPILRETFQLAQLCRSGSAKRPSPLAPTWLRLPSTLSRVSFEKFSEWRGLSPHQAYLEQLRYSLGSQMTCSAPPLVGHVEKRYPFLDETMFRFLCAIPRTQILRVGKRRHLMRRSMVGILPPEILQRRTKWFATRSLPLKFLSKSNLYDRFFWEDNISFYLSIDRAEFERDVRNLEQGTSKNALYFLGAIGLEYWLRSQQDFGIIDEIVRNSAGMADDLQGRNTSSSTTGESQKKGGKAICAT